MVVTRNGLVGLNVVSLVVEERYTVIVPAQILRQNTEDEVVATLDRGESPGLVTLSLAQFMVATRNGLVGLVVVSLVIEERNIVIVPVRNLDQHTEDEGVAALDQVENRGLASLGAALFTVDIRSGLIGLSVVGHAIEEGKTVVVHVPVHFL